MLSWVEKLFMKEKGYVSSCCQAMLADGYKKQSKVCSDCGSPMELADEKGNDVHIKDV